MSAKNFFAFSKKIDKRAEIEYNGGMEDIKTAIIGGGASGLFLAAHLENADGCVLFERGERLGRKLSATGNGQGNITNLAVTSATYFSSEKGGAERAQTLIRRYDDVSLRAFFQSLGVLSIADERGRVYPASRQASALTDALRFYAERRGFVVRLGHTVTALQRESDGFHLQIRTADGGTVFCRAERVVLCVGGKAAKNFGTDGSGYALATGLGHSVTRLYPSLVQWKTDTTYTKTLKGVRINGGRLVVRGRRGEASFDGDVIFTDYGVSGDAVFRASAFFAEEIAGGGVAFFVDFLPQTTEAEILSAMQRKRATFPQLPVTELLLGVVNNQVGRAVLKRAEGDIVRAAALVKAFPLTATGSLGFDYAQVTKGGVPLSETTEHLESRLARGLFFTGEVLDADGQCGGFNLQWAYASARCVADRLNALDRGQVCE